MVLPYFLYKELPGLRIGPLEVKEERDWRPRWIGDYSYSNIKSDHLPISAMYAIQYGWDLYRLIRKVVISDTTLGPI